VHNQPLNPHKVRTEEIFGRTRKEKVAQGDLVARSKGPSQPSSGSLSKGELFGRCCQSSKKNGFWGGAPLDALKSTGKMKVGTGGSPKSIKRLELMPECPLLGLSGGEKGNRGFAYEKIAHRGGGKWFRNRRLKSWGKEVSWGGVQINSRI